MREGGGAGPQSIRIPRPWPALALALGAHLRGAELARDAVQNGINKAMAFAGPKPVGQGTGLGLSLSYGIVQKHGGRLEVSSEIGHGTTFRVTVPVQRNDTAQPQA